MMLWLKTIPQGQQVATWDRRGCVEVIAGPRLIGTWGKRVQRLQHHAAGPDQYLRVVRVDGRTDHLPGPIECWQHPVDHQGIEVREAIDTGGRARRAPPDTRSQHSRCGACSDQ